MENWVLIIILWSVISDRKNLLIPAESIKSYLFEMNKGKISVIQKGDVEVKLERVVEITKVWLNEN